MKAIHNYNCSITWSTIVVLYPKDTEKWKQFTTVTPFALQNSKLFCIPKILKNESNSQHIPVHALSVLSCFVSQRYWKMKAIHNSITAGTSKLTVVLYPKDTEKWKQFTTKESYKNIDAMLFCIPKILKNESNSQQKVLLPSNSVLNKKIRRN